MDRSTLGRLVAISLCWNSLMRYSLICLDVIIVTFNFHTRRHVIKDVLCIIIMWLVISERIPSPNYINTDWDTAYILSLPCLRLWWLPMTLSNLSILNINHVHKPSTFTISAGPKDNIISWHLTLPHFPRFVVKGPVFQAIASLPL